MRKIDAFAHIVPRPYLERLERHLGSAISSQQLRYYQEGVFHFDDALTDLDARWRRVERFGDYVQVLVLAVPPIEELGPPAIAAEFARLANDEMAELVRRHPDRFVGFACALPLNDTDASLREIDRAVGDLGALGAQVFTNVQGVPLDDPVFEPIFVRLESLDRAIWLHPTP
jgi:aminocarboxymuconate-semialdehyde decarboxylase